MPNWFVKSQVSLLDRQPPALNTALPTDLPINVDPAFLNKKEFMSAVARLEQLTEMATDKDEYRSLIERLKKSFLGGYEHDGRVRAPENRPGYK